MISIGDEGQGLHALVGPDVAQGDLDGKVSSVAAAGQQVQPLPHRSDMGVPEVGGAMVSMRRAEAFRQKHLEGSPEHILTAIAEHFLSLPIDRDDDTSLVDE